MPPEFIALISVGVFLVLILMELHVALAIGISGVVGIVLIDGWDSVAGVLQTMPYSSSAKYALFVIPMYILLGALISHAGIGERIYRAMSRIVGKLPGGLAASTSLATSAFSGISGSSLADVAAFGRVSVTEMTRHGYAKPYAAAVVAAAGAFAALIPPSVTIVLFAVIAEQSVGAMILAGVVPGMISTLVLAGYLVVTARGRGSTQVAGDEGHRIAAKNDARVAEYAKPRRSEAARPVSTLTGSDPGSTSSPWGNMKRFLKEELSALLIAFVLFAIVAGGIYSGLVTATEAGALGALAALVIAFLTIRRGKAFLFVVWDSILETARNTSMIFLILLGGALFSYSLVLSGAPRSIAEWISGLAVPPTVVIVLMLLMLIPLGAFLDGLSVMLIAVPIIVPVAVLLGFDGVWFGILVLKMIEIGLITPPIGINVFVISGIVGSPAERIFRAVVPFIVLDLAVTAGLFMFPDLVLWLPRAAGLMS